jgi:hypothetical protein
LALLQLDWGAADAAEKYSALMQQQSAIAQATSESGEQQLQQGYGQAIGRQNQFAGVDYTPQQQALLSGGYGGAMGSVAQGYGQALGELQGGAAGMPYIQQGQQQAVRSLGRGGQQAIGTIGGGVGAQQSAIQQALMGAQMQGQPINVAGQAGLGAFANAALANPYENIAFQQRLGQSSEALNRQLAARGLYNSGAGIQAQSDLINTLTGQEQQAQIDRQLALAQMGQEQSGLTQNQMMQAGGTLADIFGQGAYQQAGIQERRGQGLADVFMTGGAAQADMSMASQQQRADIAARQGESLAGLQVGQGAALSGLFDTRYAQQAANVAAQNQLDLARGADMANVQTQRGTNLMNILNQGMGSQADIALNAAQNRANIYSNLGSNIANVYQQSATTQGNVAMQRGQQQQQMFSDMGTAMGLGAMQYGQQQQYNQTLKNMNNPYPGPRNPVYGMRPTTY